MEQQHIDTIVGVLEHMIGQIDAAPRTPDRKRFRAGYVAALNAFREALRAHTPQPPVPSEVIALVNLALAHAEYELSEYVTDAQRDVVRAWLAQQPDA